MHLGRAARTGSTATLAALASKGQKAILELQEATAPLVLLAALGLLARLDHKGPPVLLDRKVKRAERATLEPREAMVQMVLPVLLVLQAPRVTQGMRAATVLQVL